MSGSDTWASLTDKPCSIRPLPHGRVCDFFPIDHRSGGQSENQEGIPPDSRTGFRAGRKASESQHRPVDEAHWLGYNSRCLDRPYICRRCSETGPVRIRLRMRARVRSQVVLQHCCWCRNRPSPQNQN